MDEIARRGLAKPCMGLTKMAAPAEEDCAGRVFSLKVSLRDCITESKS
jgi:hypothetical protein